MAALYLSFTFFLIASYAAIILFIIKQWDDQPVQDLIQSGDLASFSIVIPVRNEEKTIGSCIESILSNNDCEHLDFEIIIIDDHSTDNTLQVAQSFNNSKIKVFSLKDHLKGKK